MTTPDTLTDIDLTTLPYHTYDTFGLITLTKTRVTASATLGKTNGLITRYVARTLNKPLPYVQPDENVVATFGTAIMEPGSSISVHLMGELKSGVPLDNSPEIREVVAEALNLLTKIYLSYNPIVSLLVGLFHPQMRAVSLAGLAARFI